MRRRVRHDAIERSDPADAAERRERRAPRGACQRPWAAPVRAASLEPKLRARRSNPAARVSVVRE